MDSNTEPKKWAVVAVGLSPLNGDFLVEGLNEHTDEMFCWHISPKYGLDGYDFGGAIWTKAARRWRASRWPKATFPGE